MAEITYKNTGGDQYIYEALKKSIQDKLKSISNDLDNSDSGIQFMIDSDNNTISIGYEADRPNDPLLPKIQELIFRKRFES